MLARATTIEGDPGQIDEAADWIQQTLVPMGQDHPGSRGVLMVADRATGRSTTLTFWASHEALRVSEERARRLRVDGTTAFDAQVVDVNRFEVVVDERITGAAEHPGFARMTTMGGDPARVDDAVVLVREKIRPIALEMEGNRGLLSLVDRANGTGVTLTFWDTEAAMRATEATADEIRDDASATLEMAIASVDRCEVLVDERW
jgi:heme-degrading monooxygenase HmoA